MVFEVKALTWDGRRSFSMIGAYGMDDFGRFVVSKNGVRYDIPADAIVERLQLKIQEPSINDAPVVTREEEEKPAVAVAPPAPPAPLKPCPLPRINQAAKPAAPKKPAPPKKAPAAKNAGAPPAEVPAPKKADKKA